MGLKPTKIAVIEEQGLLKLTQKNDGHKAERSQEKNQR